MSYYRRRNNFNMVNPCQKYLSNIKPISQNGGGLGAWIKKLKKAIMDRIKNAEEVTVYYSTVYPMLIFSYYQGRSRARKIHKHFRQILKQVPVLRKKAILFDDIFGRVYQRVDYKYHCLAVFALKKAEEVRMKVSERDLLTDSYDCSVMFYYNKTQTKKLSFVIFDQFLRSLQFDSDFISQQKSQYPEQYRAFEELYQKSFEVKKQEQSSDLLDREELESDEEERPKFEIKSITNIDRQLEKHLQKDMSYYEKKIQELTNEAQTQSMIDSASDRMNQLTSRIQQLQENLYNYEKVKQSVEKSFRKGSKDSKAAALKKIIIAEKQLQSKLPIIARKRQIFDLLQKQNLLLIEGETGSGKSTQFPQMLCQFYQLFDKPQSKPVLVTQPRRLATRSLAERVAKQMSENVGGFVDYVASAGKKVNPEAKIIFKLDRIVLDQLTQDAILSKYSCLVIDEAHERTISVDVILGLIKGLLAKRKDFKIIVTSASMDIQLFEHYFNTSALRVSGRMYPVNIRYKQMDNFREGDRMHMVRNIEKVINEDILNDNYSMKSQFRGHLLCFCSGIDQINQLVKIFEKKLNNKSFIVLPLHGKLSPTEQRRVFEPTNKHKFIFASRIAQTAITIDGVRVVIDPGQDIELIYDQKFKISTMKLVEISQSSAKQRAGRAGRTAPGHCFRLYSLSSFKKRRVCKTPEMENSSLETVVLRIKSLNISDVINFPYISQPDVEALNSSLELLKLIGALQGSTGNITKIGQLLIRIPIDPFLSRAIVQGIIYEQILAQEKYGNSVKDIPIRQRMEIQQRGLVDTITVILSLLINFSNLFYIRAGDRQQGQAVKYNEFSDEQGDFFFLQNIYQKFLKLRTKGKKSSLYQQNIQTQAWVKKNFLNYKALVQTEDLVKEISKIISSFNINEKYYSEEVKRACVKLQNCKSFRDIVLSCLITSFSPHLCKYSGNPHIGYTMVNLKRPVQVYGSSNLSLLGIQADWIICYDLFSNEIGRLYCKVAHKVDYQFIKIHADPFIQEKFKIQNIQDKNPFYQQIHYSLPTAILIQIKTQFTKSLKDQNLSFLQETCPLFNEDSSEVTFFILVDQEINAKTLEKMSFKFTTASLIKKLQEYVQIKNKQVKKSFRHNYIGNIYISLKDGFTMEDIEFDRKEYSVEATSRDTIIDRLVDKCSSFGKAEVYAVDSNQNKGYMSSDKFLKKMIIGNLSQEQRQKVITVLEEYKNAYKFAVIDYNVKLMDHRKKVPRNKVLLNFFAGEKGYRNILFMSYETIGSYNPARQMNNVLQPVINSLAYSSEKYSNDGPKKQLAKKTDAYGIRPSKMQLSKRQNGINIFESECDQFEIQDYLVDLVKTKLVDFKFKFPKVITKFRQPNSKEAPKSDKIWRKQIQAILEKHKIPLENIIINIKGYYFPNKFKRITPQERNYRVNMTAQLLNFNNFYFNQLRDAINGKKYILGCQKTHVRAYYDQVIALPTRRVFQGLQQEYYYNLQLFRDEYPMLFFDLITRRIKNQDRVMIIARSPNRQDFIKPQRILSALYIPKLLKLENHEFNFLNDTDPGNDLLEQIQIEYKYQVYFGFDKPTKSLKVFCDDSVLKDVEIKLRNGIKRFKNYCQKISYRGKNLNKVVKLLNDFIDKLDKSEALAYQIFFQTRQIEVTASLTTFKKVKQHLSALSSSQKNGCSICEDAIKFPYKFINCSCVYCCYCIAEYVRTFFTSGDLVLYCPSQECFKNKVPINIIDFKTLLPEEQFQKICDLKVRRYLQLHQHKTPCFVCKFCQNIIDKTDPDNQQVLNCEVCGRVWCKSCKIEFHPGYTCKQWQSMGNLGVSSDNLLKMGIKYCPQCEMGIEKNKGCNHMTCYKCKAHICWICLDTFETGKECGDHLVAKHGGIFDRDYRQ